jgi:hypothetical protein
VVASHDVLVTNIAIIEPSQGQARRGEMFARWGENYFRGGGMAGFVSGCRRGAWKIKYGYAGLTRFRFQSVKRGNRAVSEMGGYGGPVSWTDPFRKSNHWASTSFPICLWKKDYALNQI